MKTCTICKKNKAKSEFNKHSRRKDGLQSHCRTCNQKRSKQYYSDNKEAHKKEIYRRKQYYTEQCRQWIYGYLKSHPCVDCGEDDPVVLEFDHVRGNKIKSVGAILRNNPSLNIIKKEIRKCDVRCANCHRRKTAKDFGFWTTKMGR